MSESDIGFFIERFRDNPDGPAIAWRDDVYTYGWLADDIAARRATLERHCRVQSRHLG